MAFCDNPRTRHGLDSSSNSLENSRPETYSRDISILCSVSSIESAFEDMFSKARGLFGDVLYLKHRRNTMALAEILLAILWYYLTRRSEDSKRLYHAKVMTGHARPFATPTPLDLLSNLHTSDIGNPLCSGRAHPPARKFNDMSIFPVPKLDAPCLRSVTFRNWLPFWDSRILFNLTSLSGVTLPHTLSYTEERRKVSILSVLRKNPSTPRSRRPNNHSW
ncbi:hypothetical protein BC835DRAFT_1328575 [Cytidiella melzeri]|nr:hypothetical protein BC835DRAFT_1328575 [Cytidiella melzeri]